MLLRLVKWVELLEKEDYEFQLKEGTPLGPNQVMTLQKGNRHGLTA